MVTEEEEEETIAGIGSRDLCTPSEQRTRGVNQRERESLGFLCLTEKTSLVRRPYLGFLFFSYMYMYMYHFFLTFLND